MLKHALIAAALLIAATSAAQAKVIDVSAGPYLPNAGPGIPGYPYNPVIALLAAGTYTVSVVGIAGGGLYDAWTINQPVGNGSYTDGFHFNLSDGSVFNVVTGVNYNSGAEALAAYEALMPVTFTIVNPGTASFYLNDGALPYFGDDAGGVSVAINPVPLPEPTALALFGSGLAGIVLATQAGRRAAALA